MDLVSLSLAKKYTDEQISTIVTPIVTPPADYIVEQGSNANGNWTKWNSGKMEVWGVKYIGSVPITQSEGGIYVSADSYMCFFPVAFYSSPAFCEVQIYLVGSNHDLWVVPRTYGDYGLRTNRTWYFKFARGDSDTVDTVSVSYHAIGRWKA